MIENMLRDRYPQANFIFRRIGVDVEVTEPKWIDTIGFRYAEIKPLTASGKSKLGRQRGTEQLTGNPKLDLFAPIILRSDLGPQ
jgi:hypothetical protein